MPKSPLKMGRGFEARAAHPCPTQIWVPPGLIYHAEPEMNPGAEGVLSGKVGTGMFGPDRVLFQPLRFTNGPLFLFENWFRYRSRFSKMHNFRWIFPLVYL